MFPVGDGGVGGCIIHRPQQKPATDGTLVYLNVDGKLDEALEPAQRNGGKVLVPRTAIGGSLGFYAVLVDSEGNHIGLHSRSPIPPAGPRKDIWACAGTFSTLVPTSMRRADRLFRIVQMLRSGRLKTARALAERLQVSERTVYRDIRDLQLAGQPIEGEAGVGYTLRRDFDLPPLLFTSQDLTALVLGARLVKAWGGLQSAEAASAALARIEAVLPPELTTQLDRIALFAPQFGMPHAHRALLDQLHTACLTRTILHFRYTRLGKPPQEAEARCVRPLALASWSGNWTLAARCEPRNDFRNFRLKAGRHHRLHLRT